LDVQPLQISNPTLGFRLDPGEPGMLRRGKASEATLLVTSQEHRNLVRMKSEAIRDGRVIIHAGIKFGRKFAGSFLTTASGLTTVISRPARPSPFELEAERATAQQTSADRAPAFTEPLEAEADAATQFAPGAGRVLADHENRLRAELRRLEVPGLGEPAAEPDFVSGRAGKQQNDPLRPLEEASARREETGRQEEARHVEGELRRLHFQRVLGSMAGAAGLAATA
jgi:hypothetical protein